MPLGSSAVLTTPVCPTTSASLGKLIRVLDLRAKYHRPATETPIAKAVTPQNPVSDSDVRLGQTGYAGVSEQEKSAHYEAHAARYAKRSPAGGPEAP